MVYILLHVLTRLYYYLMHRSFPATLKENFDHVLKLFVARNFAGAFSLDEIIL